MYLDSCLHCGASHPEITSYIGQPLRHRIKCTGCPHVIECFSSSIHHAKDAWNRRSDASLADAQVEIARLRGALEVCRGYAIEFPDSLLRDNLLDTAAEALK